MGDPASPGPLTVLLVQPHPVTLLGLRTVLGSEPDVVVVGEAATGQQALEQSAQLHPDVVLLDTRLPDLSGLELVRRLRRRSPPPRLVVFSSEDQPWAIRAIMIAGAAAYLLKSAPPEEVVQAIRIAGRGQRFVSAEVSARLDALFDAAIAAEPLSPRELEVLAHLASGETNGEVARCLGLAVKTVEMHVSSLLAKLGTRSRTQAALVAVELGLVQLRSSGPARRRARRSAARQPAASSVARLGLRPRPAAGLAHRLPPPSAGRRGPRPRAGWRPAGGPRTE